MFISINHIPVKEGREKDFEKLFIERDRSVEKQPGFHSLDILRPGRKLVHGQDMGSENNYYMVMTRWESEEAFRAWVGSDAFRKSHSRDSDPTIFDGKSFLTVHHAVEGAGAIA